MSLLTRRQALRFTLAALFSAAGLLTSWFSQYAKAGTGGGEICCPRCTNKVCAPTPTNLKDKKTNYHCDCKEVCIPGIKGPFAPCCEPPKCGRVRTVTVLKKTEYDCDRCGYSWKVTTAACSSCK